MLCALNCAPKPFTWPPCPSGISSKSEKRSFTRLTFTTAYSYLLPPYSFQIRVGALYLIYGLYYMQPAWPKEKIRIALKDWYDLQKLVVDAKSCQHLDIVYIFKRLLLEKAFYFTALPKKLTFQSSERIQHHVNEEFRGCRDAVGEVASVDMLDEIANVHGHYERLKKLSLPTSLGVTLINLTDSIGHCVLEYRKWQEEIAAAKKKDSKQTETTQKSESTSRADMLAAIKSKSCSHASKGTRSRRHRPVEIATTSNSGSDQALLKSHVRPPSLKTRTYNHFGKPGEPEQTKDWLLSVKEEDTRALKRKDSRRFKWHSN